MINFKKTALFDIDKILAKIKIEAGQKVAELGCGNFGFFVFPWAKLVGKKGKVYAVDILRDSLKEIKSIANQENLSQIEIVWSDLEVYKGMKIETESVDTASLINVLSQSAKKLEILKEAARILKRGGKIIIVDWKKIDSPLGPDQERRIKAEELKEKTEKIGLSIKEEFETGPYHYGALLIKL